MGAILVHVANANRQPLDDTFDVHVVSARSDATVGVATNVDGRSPVRFDSLLGGQPYIVKVFPVRHRPVSQFVIPGPDDAPKAVQMYCPLHPERVRSVTFPDYQRLDAELKRVLECSTCEGMTGTGEALYEGLINTQRAGLFNLFTKMSAFGFDDRRSVWSFVDSLFRVRADRIFVDVQPALRDLVKGAVVSERFRAVNGSLHTPPPLFGHAGSFKTSEQYGNLQLTFFSTLSAPLAFKVDADIDDAAGLGHVFQVLRNSITSSTTHPYDIHQILVFRQEATLPYQLA